MTQRVVQAVLHRHGPFTLVFCSTEQPYDIPGYSQLTRGVKRLPASIFGAVTLELHEDPKTPTIQRFGIYSDRESLNRQQAERLVGRVFPGCTVSTTWERRLSNLAEPFSGMARRQLLKLAGM